MDLGIEGRRALVCGASKGLGFACALALTHEGVSATIVARDEKVLKSAADEIQSGTGRPCYSIVADLSMADGRGRVLESCPDPDILVTNGGGPPTKDFTELSLVDWHRALETNLLAAVELVRGTVPGMAQRRFGRIVNITSMTVRMPVERLDLSTLRSRRGVTGGPPQCDD
jgi:3-oxoacyl-[acyl-carrier protein] reductase